MMIIDLNHLGETGAAFTFNEPVSHFKPLVDIAADEDVSFEYPLTGNLRASRIQNIIRVTGRLNTNVKLSCSRCLESFEQGLEIELELTFAQEMPDSSRAPLPKDYELDAYQAGLIYFDGDQLDLHEPISEQVIMALPYKPLCRPACLGLCSQCGSNLNRNKCSCDTSSSNSPFAVLKQLKK